MKEQSLTNALKAGYPHFKETSGVPSWLVPNRSFAVVVDELGDTRILEASRCLGLLPDTLKEIPDDKGSSVAMWRQVCLDWPQLPLVAGIITSLLESVNRIMAKQAIGDLKVEPQVIFRCLMVIAFAPFVPQGRAVMQDMAAILESDAANPAHLVTRYADAVLYDDQVTLTRITDCINGYHDWACWADFLQQLALSSNWSCKLVAVTPPLSEGLADVLADMIKEASTYGA